MAKRQRKNNQQKTARNPHAAGRPVNEKAKAKFLRIYPDCGTVEMAAKQVPITPKTVYSWIKGDPEFAAKVEEIKPVAKAAYVGVLEQEAFRRAVEGVEEPVYLKGFLVGTVRKYSDTLLIFLLKGAAPEKYREKTEITGAGGGPVQMVIKEVEVRLSDANGS
ncbi:MAG: hypothetical protein PHQ43_10680 [Dehalococcoidales bacterium]|nr:hypothetical protein [Dehalococcoidales bacterium]